WLMIHGREGEAEKIVGQIENKISARQELLQQPKGRLRIIPRSHTPLREVWQAIAFQHRRRTFLGLALMASQAFFYNAIFFTYALVLVQFYGLPPENVGGYLFPFAIGNFIGPLILGRFFDTVGRKQM